MTPDGIIIILIIFLFKEYVYVLIFLLDEAPREMRVSLTSFSFLVWGCLGLKKKKQKTLPKAWKIRWELVSVFFSKRCSSIFVSGCFLLRWGGGHGIE